MLEPTAGLQLWHMGGCYANDRQESTPKRHQLWSNDEALLLRLSLSAGFLSKADLDMFTGLCAGHQISVRFRRMRPAVAI